MDENAKDKLLKDANLKKPLSPMDVANKALYLASDETINISGQIIEINRE